MSTLRTILISTLLLLPAGAALAQSTAQSTAPSPIVTDRPGFLFSSLIVGRGVFQTEWGIPAVTTDSSGGVDTRLTSLFGLVRYGVTQNFELRLDSPVYNEARVRVNGHTVTDSGYGDLEAGAKWHLFDNQGARPSFALIPSDGASDSSFLGGGIKYLVSNDFQLDLSFDRGLTADSPDWLFGFGIAARF